MATVRLIVVLLVVGVGVLLGVQNLNTTLPLVVLGASTQALPLGVWLVGAMLLGALTTLALTLLLSRAGGPGGRSGAYKYRPQPFYEPAPGPNSGATAGANSGATASGSGTGSRGYDQGRSAAAATAADPSWQDWTSFQSPGRWNDWESLSRSSPSPSPSAARPTSGKPGPFQTVVHWFSSSKRQAYQQQLVNESLRELDDWDDTDRRAYRAPGASPVDDSLNDIAQGWGPTDDSQPDPRREIDTAPTPRRVYRDGSLYSYGYRDDALGDTPGQVDHIYGPPDDAIYGDAPVSAYGGDYPLRSGYSTDAPASEFDEDEFEAHEFAGDDTPLGEPEVAEDGVVDADYRVIVPPYPTAAESAATAPPWVDRDTNAGRATKGDEWDEADDALTP